MRSNRGSLRTSLRTERRQVSDQLFELVGVERISERRHFGNLLHLIVFNHRFANRADMLVHIHELNGVSILVHQETLLAFAGRILEAHNPIALPYISIWIHYGSAKMLWGTSSANVAEVRTHSATFAVDAMALVASFALEKLRSSGDGSSGYGFTAGVQRTNESHNLPYAVGRIKQARHFGPCDAVRNVIQEIKI